MLYCLFGGAGPLIGPILGAAVIEPIRYFLSGSQTVKHYWPVLLGVLLLVAAFSPTGLSGLLVSTRERVGALGWRGP